MPGAFTERSEPVVNLQGADHLTCVSEQLSGTNVKVITLRLCLSTPTTGNLRRYLNIIYFNIDRLPQSECQSEVIQNAVYDELVSFGIHAFSAVQICTVNPSSCDGIHSLLLRYCDLATTVRFKFLLSAHFNFSDLLTLTISCNTYSSIYNIP